MNVQLKICGMRDNIEEITPLLPDYLGYIFYEKSPRNFQGKFHAIPPSIKKVGVFVDADVAFISEKIKTFGLDVVQLHGDESPTFCKSIAGVEVWKVFSIKDQFDFEQLLPYESVVDKFLFDTKGKEKGGNGYRFDWRVLHGYTSTKPIVLSGGIGMAQIEELEQLLTTNLPIAVIDVNSKFERSPGLKDSNALRSFKNAIVG